MGVIGPHRNILKFRPPMPLTRGISTIWQRSLNKP